MKESIVQNKSFQFSLKVISLFKELQDEKEFVISRQLLRSWTSIGANIEEASAGQSKRDFIAKCPFIQKKPGKQNIGWGCYRKVI